MTGDIKKISEIKNTPCPIMIQLAEEMLKEIKEGKVYEFEITARYEAGQILTMSAGDRNDVYSMFGSLIAAALSYRDTHIS